MTLKNYPVWTCQECAKAHGGSVPAGHICCFHMDICDVCFTWKSVTEPRDFGYPKFAINRDLDKMYVQLMKGMYACQKSGCFDAAIEINYRIDALLHEMYEAGLNDGTAITISGKHRRDLEKRNKMFERSTRQNAQKSLRETRSA